MSSWLTSSLTSSATAGNLLSTTRGLTTSTTSVLASAMTTSQSTMPSIQTSQSAASLLTPRLLGNLSSPAPVGTPSVSAGTVVVSQCSSGGITQSSTADTCHPTAVGTSGPTPVCSSSGIVTSEERIGNGSQAPVTQGRRPSILRSFLAVQPSTEADSARPAVSAASSVPHSDTTPRNTPLVIYNQSEEETPNHAPSDTGALSGENRQAVSEAGSDSSSDTSPSHRSCEICQHMPVLPRPLARPRYLNRRHRWLMRYGAGRRGLHRNVLLARRPNNSANNSDRSQSNQPHGLQTVSDAQQNNMQGSQEGVDSQDRENPDSSSGNSSSESESIESSVTRHVHQRINSLSQFDSRMQQLTARRVEAGRGRVGPRSPRLHYWGQRIQERQRRLRQHLEEIRRR